MMNKYFKFLLLMPICVVIGGCIVLGDRWSFSVEGRVVNRDGKSLDNCTFTFVEPNIKWGRNRIDSVFFETGMVKDPIETLSHTVVEIDCGENYEIYRSPSLISFNKLSINLGKIVIYSKK